jgi:hypothetical protein
LIGTGVGIAAGMSSAAATTAAVTGGGAATTATTTVLNATGGDPTDELQAIGRAVQHGLVAVQNGMGQGYNSCRAFKAAQGGAGSGMAWHHIVPQTPANLQQFGAQVIHNTNNLIRLPHGAGSPHQKITNLYNSINPAITGSATQRVYQWVQNQPFEKQWELGVDLIIRFGGSKNIIDKFIQ